MMPVTELLSIPFFLALHPDLNPVYVYFWAVTGNMIPCFLILTLLPKFTDYIHKNFHEKNIIKKIIDWVYAKVHARHSGRMDYYGGWALFMLILLPIPGTGVWTCSILACLFNISFHRAFISIGAGTILFAIAILILSTYGIDVVKYLG